MIRKSIKNSFSILYLFSSILIILSLPGCRNSAVISTEKANDGLLITLNNGAIFLQVKDDNIIHVRSWKEKPAAWHQSLAVIDDSAGFIDFPVKADTISGSAKITTATADPAVAKTPYPNGKPGKPMNPLSFIPLS